MINIVPGCILNTILLRPLLYTLRCWESWLLNVVLELGVESSQPQILNLIFCLSFLLSTHTSEGGHENMLCDPFYNKNAWQEFSLTLYCKYLLRNLDPVKLSISQFFGCHRNFSYAKSVRCVKRQAHIDDSHCLQPKPEYRGRLSSGIHFPLA